MQIESNLLLMKDQGWFKNVDPLRLLGLVTLRLHGLDWVILWVIQKEIVFAIN